MNKFIKKIANKKTFYATLLAILVLIITKRYNMIIFAISLYCLYIMISSELNHTIFDSFLLRFVLVFFCYTTLLQCTTLVSWLLYRDALLTFTPSLLFIFIIVFYAIRIKSQPTNNILSISQKPFDILSILVAFLTIALIALPPVLQSSSKQDRKAVFTMSLINSRDDDGAHLAFLNDIIHFDKAVIARSSAKHKARNPGAYPTSWHAINALFIKSLFPRIETGQYSLLAYGLSKLFWLFFLTYLITRVSFCIYSLFYRRKINIINYVSLAITSSVACILFILPMSMYGFYNYFPQLITAVLAIPILIQIGFTGARSMNAPFFIICLGGSLSWFLPLPAFLLCTSTNILLLLWKSKTDGTVKKTLKSITRNWLIVLFLSASIFIQFLTLRSSDTPIPILESILMDGGIMSFSIFFYGFMVIGLVISLAQIKKKTIWITPLVVLLASLSALCVFVCFLQIMYAGKTTYYYFKLLYILLVILIPFSISGYAKIIGKITNNNTYYFIFLIIFIINILFLMLTRDMSFYYALGSRSLTNDTNIAVVNEIRVNLSQKNYFEKRYSFFYRPIIDFYPENAIATRITKANMRDSSCLSSVWDSILVTPNTDIFVENITRECKGYEIKILTKSEYFSAFSNSIDKYGASEMIKLVSY